MDLGNGTRVHVRPPNKLLHVVLPNPDYHVGNSDFTLNDDNPSIRIGVENLLRTVPGRVFVDHGAPSEVEFPDYAGEGANYVDLDNGNWYVLGVDMEWVLVGDIQPEGVGLTPEEIQEIVDDAEAEVLADLEPPIDLVVLFQNSLA